MDRRKFFGAATALAAAPWVCTKAGVLMPVKQVIEAPGYWMHPHADNFTSAWDFGEPESYPPSRFWRIEAESWTDGAWNVAGWHQDCE